MGMHIVIVGNVVDGLHFVGPFKTVTHAIEWAKKYRTTDDWVTAPLEYAFITKPGAD